MKTYDVIVLGAGAMGSAAAYYLARAGQRTLLLEQFEIDHQWGSSWGYTRIIRYSYDVPRYIQLAYETYPLWDDLEREAGETFIVRTGGIDFGPVQDASLRATIQAVQEAGLKHDLLTPAEAQARFPQFRFHDDMQVLYQPDSGLITPSRAVRAHVRLAQKHGAEVRDRTPITRFALNADGVTVWAGDEKFTAGQLILAGGAWARRLLRENADLDLPLAPMRCQEAHFYPRANREAYSPANMPVYIYYLNFHDGEAMYGLPDYEGNGVKSAFHGGQDFDHPSEISYEPSMDEIARIRETIGEVLPTLRDAELGLTRICLYTMTPDHHYIIDQHPAYPQLIIGAGFSGHGFKFSTGIGKIMAELAVEGRSPYNIDLFRLRRFEEQTS